MNHENCIFCKVVKGELPSSKVYENDEIMAFLDINPVNLGHTLVIPKKHFENIYETPEDTLAHMITASKNIAKAIKKHRNADGVNVIMNNDASAGQVIFHSHIHVIPRFKDDGFGVWTGKDKYKEGEKDQMAQDISQAL